MPRPGTPSALPFVERRRDSRFARGGTRARDHETRADGPGLRRRLRHRVVQLVPAVHRRRLERALGVLGHQTLEHRVELLRDEPFALLAALPDVEDPEDAAVVVEPGRVDDQPVRAARETEPGDDGVVVLRARVTADDLELLDVGNGHDSPPRSSCEPMLVRIEARARGRHPTDYFCPWTTSPRSTSPRHAPDSLERCSTSFLNRSRSALIRRSSLPSFAPRLSSIPSGSQSICTMIRELSSERRWNVTTPECALPSVVVQA